MPMHQGGILNSRRAASPLVRLVEGEERQLHKGGGDIGQLNRAARFSGNHLDFADFSTLCEVSWVPPQLVPGSFFMDNNNRSHRAQLVDI
ncbi:hypothetical protein TNCV_4443421 [Trichonephila clavipes]|nr:hypothetical protein TNCV_4443421 [Trichonephila clavipes]